MTKIENWLETANKNGSNAQKHFLIAGSCSAETEAQMVETALGVQAAGADWFRAGVWKPRTRPNSFEGVGEIGLSWLQTVKKLTGMPVCTEIATAAHTELALKYGVDVLWIGARTTVNPFAVQEIAEVLRGVKVPVLVKNPVNPDLELWMGGIERLLNVGVEKIGAIHRGFSVYNKTLYRNEPLWEIPIELHRRMPDLPILNDPSHISGDRKLLLEVAQQALDLGFVNGFMIESHPNPDQAWSDAKQQLTPQALSKMMCELQTRDQSCENPDFEHALSAFRAQIDVLDAKLLDILAERMQVVREIGKQKQAHNISILQIERWKQIFNSRTAQAEPKKLSVLFVAELLQAIHKESISQQTALIKTLSELLAG